MDGRRTNALTGGPGGGKTTPMEELRRQGPRVERWILVSEAAPSLFRAGLEPRVKRF
ncbi:MAG TPA: hypothetical protein VFJ58_16680 [Armatimonadota bacterium]|nr:hypothetical protein [Armatimonadota bacterium]